MTLQEYLAQMAATQGRQNRGQTNLTTAQRAELENIIRQQYASYDPASVYWTGTQGDNPLTQVGGARPMGWDFASGRAGDLSLDATGRAQFGQIHDPETGTYYRVMGQYGDDGVLGDISYDEFTPEGGWLNDNLPLVAALTLAGMGGYAALTGGGAGGAGTAGSAVGGTMGGAGLVEPASGLGGAVAGGAASGAGTAAGAGTVAGLLSNPASLAAGANLVGGVLGSNAASDAAQQQQDAANAAIAEQRRQFDTTRSDLQPWMQAGQTSLSDLMANMNALTKPYTPADLQNDPGYQFQMSEGQKALDAAARARGGYGSSGALRELLRYSQGLASQSYGDAYNRDMASKLQKYNMLAGVSGTGQTTANNLGSFGSSNAQTVGDLLTQSGNAGAAGTVGSANAWNSALGNTVNAYQQQNWLNRIGSNLYGR